MDQIELESINKYTYINNFFFNAQSLELYTSCARPHVLNGHVCLFHKILVVFFGFWLEHFTLCPALHRHWEAGVDTWLNGKLLGLVVEHGLKY